MWVVFFYFFDFSILESCSFVFFFGLRSKLFSITDATDALCKFFVFVVTLDHVREGCSFGVIVIVDLF